ncbi:MULTISPECIES: hypothetical protein [Rhizobium]|uniref:hypothetical protein n=1 Tax=Rhizobium TaxID=379 RepID=UPI0028B1B858|nr:MULTISPECIES: hypothetical protein [Rhizobium]
MHTHGGTDGFDPEAVTEMRSRLVSVREQGLRIGFAIESGNRAWGFPFPGRDERGQHLADKFYVQEVLQRDS